MRLLLVQYAGDFLDAYNRLQETGTETYYGHRYIFETLERIQKDFGETAILCCLSETEHSVRLPSNVTVMGAKADPDKQADRIVEIIDKFDPTHLVVLGPMPELIRQAAKKSRRAICICADSFNTGALRRWVRYGRIGSLFNSKYIEWVANHGTSSCASLAKIGVDPKKIVAWDWPHPLQPDQFPQKSAASSRKGGLLYVGALTKTKGLGDVIQALALLKKRGVEIGLKIAGRGDDKWFGALAEKLGVAGQLDFLGLIGNNQVIPHMQQAWAVVVPSRHQYPEGLPLTIYEALCSRTPIIASDHPMFRRHLVNDKTALTFRATRADELAACIERLQGDSTLYDRLSTTAQTTWEGLQISVKWGDLLYRWVRDDAADRAWLAQHSLSRSD